MKPRLYHLALFLSAAFIVNTLATPIGKDRPKRSDCLENDDQCLEDSYWREVVPIGFFINNAGAGGAADATGAKRELSNSAGPINAGSGSGSHVTRSDIPGQKPEPAQVATPKPEVAAPPASVAAPTKDEDIKKSLFCQGEKEWLQCPMYRVIQIKKAFWGRSDANPCNDRSVTRTLKTDKMCAQDEANTMKKVQTMCNDEEACELVASDTFFDRTDCPDVYKYVELEYQCLHREMRVKDVSDKSG